MIVYLFFVFFVLCFNLLNEVFETETRGGLMDTVYLCLYCAVHIPLILYTVQLISKNLK